MTCGPSCSRLSHPFSLSFDCASTNQSLSRRSPTLGLDNGGKQQVSLVFLAGSQQGIRERPKRLIRSFPTPGFGSFPTAPGVRPCDGGDAVAQLRGGAVFAGLRRRPPEPGTPGGDRGMKGGGGDWLVAGAVTGIKRKDQQGLGHVAVGRKITRSKSSKKSGCSDQWTQDPFVHEANGFGPLDSFY